MKRKYIVISMALLSAVSTWAQEITGTVTDAKSDLRKRNNIAI